MERGDAYIALPGGVGTLDELMEVWAVAQAGLMDKPMAVLNVNHYYDGLLTQLERAYQDKLLKEKDYAGFIRSDNSMHGIIFEAAGQKLAGDTIMNVNGHYDRFRILTMQDEKTMANAIRQHEHIVDLMEQGDKEQNGHGHCRKARLTTGCDTGSTFNIGSNRGCTEDCRENRPHSIGIEGLVEIFNLAVLLHQLGFLHQSLLL